MRSSPRRPACDPREWGAWIRPTLARATQPRSPSASVCVQVRTCTGTVNTATRPATHKFGGEGFHTRVSHLHAAEIHCVLRPCELSITSLGLCKKQIHFVLETCSSFHSRTQKIDVESPRLSSMVRNISNIAAGAPVRTGLSVRAVYMLYPLALSNSISSSIPTI